MSKSPLDQKQNELQVYLSNWNALSSLIRQGGSFSGRERNCVFLNLGSKSEKWADVSGVTGLDLIDDGRAIATCDWDHDGDLDIWLANRTGPRIRFMRNNDGTRNGSVQLLLIGTKQNRDAIGARVQLRLTDGSERIRTLRAGGGFVSQSSKWLHFGLGPDQRVERLVVRWPDGQQQNTTAVRTNGRYTIQWNPGPSPTVTFDQQGSRETELTTSKAMPVSIADATRIVLTKRRPLTQFSYLSSVRKETSFETAAGSPTLINLWASWCPTCQAELTELKTKWTRLQAEGVNVLALCANELIDSPNASNAAGDVQSVISRFELPFATGFATKEILDRVTSISQQAIYRNEPLPLPASFLVDSRGQLAVIYRGRLPVDQLIEDIKLAKQPTSNMEIAFPFSGQDGIKLFPRAAVDVAAAYEEGGYFDDAEQELVRYLVETKRAIAARTLKPTSKTQDRLEEAYLSLIALLRRQQRQTDAEAVLQQALRLFPRSNRLRHVLTPN